VQRLIIAPPIKPITNSKRLKVKPLLNSMKNIMMKKASNITFLNQDTASAFSCTSPKEKYFLMRTFVIVPTQQAVNTSPKAMKLYIRMFPLPSVILPASTSESVIESVEIMQTIIVIKSIPFNACPKNK
jgi:hypothetical protein